MLLAINMQTKFLSVRNPFSLIDWASDFTPKEDELTIPDLMGWYQKCHLHLLLGFVIYPIRKIEMVLVLQYIIKHMYECTCILIISFMKLRHPQDILSDKIILTFHWPYTFLPKNHEQKKKRKKITFLKLKGHKCH